MVKACSRAKLVSSLLGGLQAQNVEPFMLPAPLMKDLAAHVVETSNGEGPTEMDILAMFAKSAHRNINILGAFPLLCSWQLFEFARFSWVRTKAHRKRLYYVCLS